MLRMNWALAAGLVVTAPLLAPCACSSESTNATPPPNSTTAAPLLVDRHRGRRVARHPDQAHDVRRRDRGVAFPEIR